jgi:hypothetical protein
LLILLLSYQVFKISQIGFPAMLNRSVIFGAGLILSLLPSVAMAQTKPSWQEWSKQNPTYPNAPASPAPSSTPAASWSNNSASTSSSTANLEQQYRAEFMQGCTGSGAPEAYCSCTFNGLRSRYSMTELSDMFSQSDPPMGVLKEIAASCLAQSR